MTDTFTDLDLLEEIRKYYPHIPKRDGGITIGEYGDTENIGEKKARTQLSKLIKQGVLYRERCRCDDNVVRWVYYRTEK